MGGGRFTVSFASSLLWSVGIKPEEVGSEGPILVLLLLHSSCLVPVFFFSHVLGWPVCFCLFWGFIIHLGKCNTWSFSFLGLWFSLWLFFLFYYYLGWHFVYSFHSCVFFFPSLGMGGGKRNKNIQISTIFLDGV